MIYNFKLQISISKLVADLKLKISKTIFKKLYYGRSRRLCYPTNLRNLHSPNLLVSYTTRHKYNLCSKLFLKIFKNSPPSFGSLFVFCFSTMKEYSMKSLHIHTIIEKIWKKGLM